LPIKENLNCPFRVSKKKIRSRIITFMVLFVCGTGTETEEWETIFLKNKSDKKLLIYITNTPS
jgi:hypothetical protein